MANRVRLLHRLLQTLLALLFFAQLNFLAMRNYARYDVTRNHFFTLSPETRAYLGELAEPVDIIVTIPSNSPQPDTALLFEYAQGLLEQYSHALQQMGRSDLFEVEYVNIFKDVARAQELANRYGLEQENMILVRGENRTRFLSPADLFEFEGMEAQAFKGEQALTSALLEVTTADRPTIYFTVGHGEMRLDDVDPNRGLSTLAAILEEKNFAVGHLDLSQAPAVPDNADLVMIADPRGPFLPAEQEKLRRYLNDQAGRVALLLAPGHSVGLDALLEDWGVRADDMVVLETGPNFVGTSGSFLLRRFREHPITDPLTKNEVFLVAGLLRPVRPDPGAAIDDRLAVLPLVFSSDTSWGESAYTGDGRPDYNPSVDLPGPVVLGALAQRRSASQLGIEVPGGRLLALGAGDLFANRRLTSALGNQLFLLSSVNWLLERDQTLALPPRPIEQYQLNLSQGELQEIALYFLAVPVAAGMLGLLVVWIRKF
ncbi:MAG: GldG family protein [Opitutales bacterium]